MSGLMEYDQNKAIPEVESEYATLSELLKSSVASSE